MSRRAGDWSLVGRDSDPVPADGSAVDRLAADFEGRGRDMTTAADVLSRLAKRTEWVGEAGESFADEAGSTHEDLADAARKYVDAGKALRTFSEAVFHAHNETWAGLLAAELADGDRARNADPAPGSAVPAATPDPAAEAEESRRRARLLQAQDELAAARRRVDQAMHALDEAAQRARKAIDAASGHYKDGFWDDVKGFVSTAIKALLDVLNVIAIILAVVIIVLVVIGTGGGALALLAATYAAYAMTAAFWVGVAILGGTLIQASMGEADGSDIAWAVLGVAGARLGSIGGRLGKLGATTMRGAARGQVAAAARAAVPGSVTRGLTDFGPRSRVLAQRIIDGRVARELQSLDDGLAAAAHIGNRPLRTLVEVLDLTDSVAAVRQARYLDTVVSAQIGARELPSMAAVQQVLGSGMSLTSQIHDFSGAKEVFTSLPEDLADAWDEQVQLGRSMTSIVGVGR